MVFLPSRSFSTGATASTSGEGEEGWTAGKAAGELRDLAMEVRAGCTEMAGAIEGALPPAPGGPAGDESAEGGNTGG